MQSDSPSNSDNRPAPSVEALLREGIAAARAGQRTRARALLTRVVEQDDGNVQARLWLAGIAPSLDETESHLRKVLALDPDNPKALGGLRWVQEQRAVQPPARAEAAEPEEPPAQPPPAAPGKGRGNEFVLIGVLGLILLGLLAAEAVQGALPAPLPVLRFLLGVLFVLFVPGYALQAALFPRAADLDGPERLAVSIGLSVAAIPPMALLLDALPWGIRLWPVVACEGVLIITAAAVAWLRRKRLPEPERFRPVADVNVRGWWAAQSRTHRILYGVLAVSLAAAAIAAAAILAPNESDRPRTEFYVLGAEGLAENYPRTGVVGQPLAVRVGIVNHEGRSERFVVRLRLDGQSVGEVGPLDLADGARWEEEVRFVPEAAGIHVQLDLLLFREGGDAPLRSLLLWLDEVAEPEG